MILTGRSITILILLITASLAGSAQDQDTVARVTRGAGMSLYAEDNDQNCLRCHGKLVFTITDTVSGLSRKELMAEHNFISSDAFYNSVHWSFSCLDCHSEGFKSFPH